MSEPFLGEIIMFGGNFAPRGWAFCNGQLMSISQNSALFSILGTTYGAMDKRLLRYLIYRDVCLCMQAKVQAQVGTFWAR